MQIANPIKHLAINQPLRQVVASAVVTIASLAALLGSTSATAQTIDFAQAPLLTLKPAPALVMLTMGRDLPLYKAAYNDVNDIDGDGVPDLFFKPAFKYEGYFAYDRCYDYENNVFTPKSIGAQISPDKEDASKNYYKCPGKWSGNFLNWVTMSRIDVLRKVLYGGKRSKDTTKTTILERSYIPQDGTIWGKEYFTAANDGYKITDYTPLEAPEAGKRHMFANTTQRKGNALYTTSANLNPPHLIIYKNREGRLWDLVATERPILGEDFKGEGGNPILKPETPLIVRVETCILLTPTDPAGPARYEVNCAPYTRGVTKITTIYKPTGMLQLYGEKKTLAFGLLSGSYDKNYSGGVLRQNIDDFNREVDASTGVFTDVKGVVYHLNELRPWGFGDDASLWDCSFNFSSLRTEGSCGMWGNPLGEMMYETLRYFSGATAGTPEFTKGVGDPTHVIDNGITVKSPEPAGMLDLQRPAWINPYKASEGRTAKDAYPKCSRPVQMVIGDPKTSFDSDQLPGAYKEFIAPSFAGSLGTLNVSDEANLIWNTEASQPGSGITATKKFFIGQAGTLKDGNPSAKTVTSFSNIRGHGPDATTNQGSFYGASVARYGKFTGLANPELTSKLRVDQISIALDSSIPQIKIPLNGNTISIIPISKSIGGCSPMTATQHGKGGWQPTGEISGFFVEKVANTNAGNIDASLNDGKPYYAYSISYADNDQGSDNEKDAVLRYVIQQTASNQISIGLEILSEATCMTMHQGYVISGTTNDGVYLDVGGQSGANTTLGYFLDTPKNKSPGSAEATGTGPLYTDIPATLKRSSMGADARLFSSGPTETGGFVPHDMLWYAAKYGGASFNEATGAASFKWKRNSDPKSDPENYYFANNPAALASQMGQAFQKAASIGVASASAVTASGAKVQGGNFVYQAGFDSARWGGELRAFEVQGDGNISNTPTWLATAKQPAPAARTMVLGRGGKTKLALTTGGYTSLTASEKAGFGGSTTTYDYLLGDRSKEQPAGNLRTRTSAIGDIVNSDPLYIGKSDFGYIDTSYDTFKGASDPKLIAFGSNDGAYRLLDGTTGVEKLAFFPQATSANLFKLADPAYTHQYFVDGPSSFGHVRNGSTAAWNTVLAASAGAGGKSLFALNASATDFANNGVLWEVNDTTVQSGSNYGDRMGNIINKPLIGQLPTNVGAVLSGNGVNSADGKASLMIVNAITGQVIRACSPTNAANTADNGMTSLASVSVGKNGKMDYIYGADYKGNIWRMEPDSAICDSAAVKIFTAKDTTGKTQAITGELTVISAPNGMTGNMIVFGTGKYATAADVSNVDPQSLYGVWDDLSTTKSAARADLVNFPIGAKSNKNTRMTAKAADVNGGKAWFEASASGTASTKKGWVIDLSCSGCPQGERFVDKPILAGNDTSPAMYFLSYVPSTDPCKVGGGGWVTGINPYTGAYTKAYKNIDDNSAFVNGVTPRGLFIVKSDATSTTKSSEYLYVVTNDPDNNPDSPFGVRKGAKTTGSDGSGTGGLGAEITPASPPAAAIRRQVWRQIQ
jgi:type IV pilus assembly protein PilY1